MKTQPTYVDGELAIIFWEEEFVLDGIEYSDTGSQTVRPMFEVLPDGLGSLYTCNFSEEVDIDFFMESGLVRTTEGKYIFFS